MSLAEDVLYGLDATGKDDPAPNWWAAIQEAELVPALDSESTPMVRTPDLTKHSSPEPSPERPDPDPADEAELDDVFDVEQGHPRPSSPPLR